MAVAMPSSRNPMNGLSWEEEVVPALRKRLESESRTLTKRMSAISLSSRDHSPVPSANGHNDATYTRHEPAYYSQDLQSNTGAPRSRSTTQDSGTSSFERTTAVASTSRTNGVPSQLAPKKKPPSQSQPLQPRTRTYSQPYLTNSDSTSRPGTGYRGKANGNGKLGSDLHGSHPLNMLAADIRPTRIPKASRTASGHSPPLPQTNGTNYTAHPYKIPDVPATTLGASSKNSSQSQVNLPDRRDPHLLNEPAPFQPGSTTSLTPSRIDDYDDGAPPRPSMESEERPFQHWYRGDVSRNGGVGELRVGKRQEMLDIANYGHKIREQERAAAAAARTVSHNYLNNEAKRRKRADSFSRLEAKEQRDSLYLDDQEADNVLDENPLTDIDNVSEDAASASDYHESYAYHHHERDNDPTVTGPEDLTITTSSTLMAWSSSNATTTTENRSTTPTFSSGHARRSSSKQREPSSSRIPQPSSRRSSDARATTPTPTLGLGRVSPGPTASTMAGSTSSHGTRQRQPSVSTTKSTGTTPSNSANAAKRGRSPNVVNTPGKAKATPSKSRSKTMPPKVDPKNEKDRRSVAYYPNPGEGAELADAIPSWTQPVPKAGNWDDVVLPVVARKQGLNDQYHTAVGKPKPRVNNDTFEPAPGTFGYDDTKGRRRRPGEPETIPMDEFGRPMYPDEQEEDQELTVDPNSAQYHQNGHDRTRLPTRSEPPPSPAPFSQYAPGTEKKFDVQAAETARLAQVERQKEEEDTGGCCKCIIM